MRDKRWRRGRKRQYHHVFYARHTHAWWVYDPCIQSTRRCRPIRHHNRTNRFFFRRGSVWHRCASSPVPVCVCEGTLYFLFILFDINIWNGRDNKRRIWPDFSIKTIQLFIISYFIFNLLLLYLQTELSHNLQQLSEKARSTTEFIQRLKGMSDTVTVSYFNHTSV